MVSSGLHAGFSLSTQSLNMLRCWPSGHVGHPPLPCIPGSIHMLSIGLFSTHLPSTMVSCDLHFGGHDGSSGFLVQSTGGHDIPITAD